MRTLIIQQIHGLLEKGFIWFLTPFSKLYFSTCPLNRNGGGGGQSEGLSFKRVSLITVLTDHLFHLLSDECWNINHLVFWFASENGKIFNRFIFTCFFNPLTRTFKIGYYAHKRQQKSKFTFLLFWHSSKLRYLQI